MLMRRLVMLGRREGCLKSENEEIRGDGLEPHTATTLEAHRQRRGICLGRSLNI
jgi:hypothetical protein